MSSCSAYIPPAPQVASATNCVFPLNNNTQSIFSSCVSAQPNFSGPVPQLTTFEGSMTNANVPADCKYAYADLKSIDGIVDCFSQKGSGNTACVEKKEGSTSTLSGTPSSTRSGSAATSASASATGTGAMSSAEGLVVGKGLGVLMGVSALVVFVAGGLGL